MIIETGSMLERNHNRSCTLIGIGKYARYLTTALHILISNSPSHAVMQVKRVDSLT